MSLPCLMSVVRLRFGLAIVMLVGALVPLRAQQAVPPAAPQPAQPQLIHLKDYSVSRSAFPNVLQPYAPEELAQPTLGNSPRIDSNARRQGLSFH